jgi:hypothetical protein
MVIFYSYVSLPEGILDIFGTVFEAIMANQPSIFWDLISDKNPHFRPMPSGFEHGELQIQWFSDDNLGFAEAPHVAALLISLVQSQWSCKSQATKKLQRSNRTLCLSQEIEILEFVGSFLYISSSVLFIRYLFFHWVVFLFSFQCF